MTTSEDSTTPEVEDTPKDKTAQDVRKAQRDAEKAERKGARDAAKAERKANKPVDEDDVEPAPTDPAAA